MNLKQLSGFLKVVELGSFTRAAAALHIAQSALSRQIMQLEDELGVPLLTRLDRGVELTEAGRVLRDQVVSVLDQLRTVKDLVNAQAAEPGGQISLGFPPSFFDLVTVPTLRVYRARYGRVLVQVHEGISGELLERVVSGRLDAAVVSTAETLDGLETVPLVTEPMIVAGPAASRATIGKRITLARLAELPLIVTTRPNTLRLVTDRALARRELKPDIALEVNTSRIAVELCAAGLGWAVLPYSAVHRPVEEGRVCAAPISGLTVTWALASSRARAMSLAMQKLRELLLQHIRETVEAGRWPGAACME